MVPLWHSQMTAGSNLSYCQYLIPDRFRWFGLCTALSGLEEVGRCEPGECTSHRNHHSGRRFLSHPTDRDKWERKKWAKGREWNLHKCHEGIPAQWITLMTFQHYSLTPQLEWSSMRLSPPPQNENSDPLLEICPAWPTLKASIIGVHLERFVFTSDLWTLTET